MKAPFDYPRRVLLAVTGVSPQVVTETLFELAVHSAPAFLPTEIHLISTQLGIDRADAALLAGGEGQFFRLLRDYQIDPSRIRFGTETLHPILDRRGEPVDDINDHDSNRAAADFIFDRVRALADDPDCAIHASMAGGRKTMGFFLAYAMSLFGRSQDRLSHVLVSPPFESSRDFFYPPTQPVELTIHGAKRSTAEAKITLADIPFVRLGSGPVLAHLQDGSGYVETVEQIQRSLEPPSLRFDLDAGSIEAHGQALVLPPVSMAVLLWMALRVKLDRRQVVLDGQERSNCRQLLRVMEEVGVPARSMEGLMTREAYRAEEFGPHRSRLNERLGDALGPMADHYCIHQSGVRTRASYELRLTAEQIEITGFGSDALIDEVLNELEEDGRGEVRAQANEGGLCR